MKLWMLAFRAASMISAIDTSLELSPYAIFRAMVRSNKVGSWDTIPRPARSRLTGIEEVSEPFTVFNKKIKVKKNYTSFFEFRIRLLLLTINPEVGS